MAQKLRYREVLSNGVGGLPIENNIKIDMCEHLELFCEQ